MDNQPAANIFHAISCVWSTNTVHTHNIKSRSNIKKSGTLKSHCLLKYVNDSTLQYTCKRCCGLVISAIHSLLRGPGLGPVILGSLCWVPWQDTLLSWCLTPPTCINGYCRQIRVTPQWTGIPSKGGTEVFLVASHYRNHLRLCSNKKDFPVTQEQK